MCIRRARHLFNSHNYDPDLRTEIYLREDRVGVRRLIYWFCYKPILPTISLTLRNDPGRFVIRLSVFLFLDGIILPR